MRLIFVNQAHPDIAHVSGMRLGNFATAMAKRDHQVVLLTSALSRRASRNWSNLDIQDALSRHNWSKPLILDVSPQTLWYLEAVRRGALPSAVRRMLTAWSFIWNGGTFADWSMQAQIAGFYLIRYFKPDAVWATFGNTSNLRLAQSIAGRAHCPWVIDIKDNWSSFVPAGLRRFMAWRFRDAAGITSNALHHLSIAERWLHNAPKCVIYSGVADSFYEPQSYSIFPRQWEVLLVGSIYSQDRLLQFMQGLQSWLRELSPDERTSIRFVYAGSDTARVNRTLSKVDLGCETEICDQLSIDQLAQRVQRTFVNCYLWAPFTFHHKLLELLTAGRPVVAFPGEHQESKGMAANSVTSFNVCNDEAELLRVLHGAWSVRHEAVLDRNNRPAWRWSDFAPKLEAFLEELKAE